MREILGEAKSVRQLLSGAKYSIDFYQREFKWGTKQVLELLEDLTSQFFDHYEPGHPRRNVEDYGHYFLGSIIISSKQGHKYIVDGQQRLTSLTLLLILLNTLQEDRDDQVNISELIYSEKFGTKSFNLDVDERARAMDALFNGEGFDDSDEPESVRNILARYDDLEEHLSLDLKQEALPYFTDWLIENVHLVEITAYADEDAYTIFETMNDRGLSLSPSDMLKGYLLANVNDGVVRWELHDLWKQQMMSLAEIDSDETPDFFKAWLRSQYARKIRERKRGALPEDFDRIGTEFHRWVRDQRNLLGLEESADFVRLIRRDMVFYAAQYRKIREASLTFDQQLEDIFYLAEYGFTLQYPLLLAPLTPDDRDEVIDQKLRIVAAYLDILLARRLWNYRSISYSTLQYAMFLIMRDIRGMRPEQLANLLVDRLEGEEYRFLTNESFALHGQNGRHVYRLLARMTDYIERRASGSPEQADSRFAEYIGGRGQNRYEIEHIWANHFQRHDDEFDHPEDFRRARNLIGGLLLLPRSFNQSYGDMPYSEKRPHYFGQNLLAKSLDPKCYRNNPGFLRFIDVSGLPFGAHEEFKYADLEARQVLATQLAELVWNPDRVAEPMRV